MSITLPPPPRPGPLGLIQYAGVDMQEYAAAVSSAKDAEIERLRAGANGLRTELLVLLADNAALRAEVAGLREFVEHVRRNGGTHLAAMAIAVLAARNGACMTIWHKSPPPSLGWWPCRGWKRIVLRWWDGQRWSWGATRLDDALAAAWLAARPETDYMQPHIEWAERPDWWPERSRT